MKRDDSELDALDRDIFNQSLVLGDRDVLVGDILGIDAAGISYEFSTQAARLAWVATLAAAAEVDYGDAKASKEVVAAQVELRIRKEMEGAKTTEAYIKSLVTTDQECIDAVSKESDALLQFKIMRAVTDAVRQRGDMLISIGATLRQELEITGMHIKDTKEVLRRSLPVKK